MEKKNIFCVRKLIIEHLKKMRFNLFYFSNYRHFYSLLNPDLRGQKRPDSQPKMLIRTYINPKLSGRIVVENWNSEYLIITALIYF